eukprot:CAMPEP_0197510390 /NCGR_PEP_ID=MMETSP1312-20131121/51453_1 /TAXON_ID=464262 /ORGANISM="Genus nov. species nov., Strain RCC2335" /LENGTH=32 /DNA_ID= /DNA_START= /DNA_END= /DNA_ORIENTATION=
MAAEDVFQPPVKKRVGKMYGKCLPVWENSLSF